jgi:hypothetical protein
MLRQEMGHRLHSKKMDGWTIKNQGFQDQNHDLTA